MPGEMVTEVQPCKADSNRHPASIGIGERLKAGLQSALAKVPAAFNAQPQGDRIINGGTNCNNNSSTESVLLSEADILLNQSNEDSNLLEADSNEESVDANLSECDEAELLGDGEFFRQDDRASLRPTIP